MLYSPTLPRLDAAILIHVHTLENFIEHHEYDASQDEGQGYVYLLKARNGLYKIGSALWLLPRLKTNHEKWQGKFDFDFVHAIYCQYRIVLESELHRLFKSKHGPVRGDWFALSPDDVEYIMSL